MLWCCCGGVADIAVTRFGTTSAPSSFLKDFANFGYGLGSVAQEGWLFFANVPGTFTTASLNMRIAALSSQIQFVTDIRQSIVGLDDNPAEPNTYADVVGPSETTASTEWVMNDSDIWPTSNDYSIDVTAILNELILRPGWTSPGNVLLRIDPNWTPINILTCDFGGLPVPTLSFT